MDYKKFCKIFSVCVIIIIITFLSLAVVVDPLGIIGSPIIKGFNHYKSKQDVYEYVWKPYLAADCRADVVIIGSSRIGIGWKPFLNGFSEKQVFNLGLSSLPFPKMQKHLEMIYSVHCPKVLLIGIDFFQFGKNNFEAKREGYSVERLNIIAKGNTTLIRLMSLKDTLNAGILPSLVTIKDSNASCGKCNRYVQGFDSERGCSKLDIESDKATLKGYKLTYGEFQHDPRAMEKLKEIIKDAQSREIKVYVFVNPIHKRLYDLLCSYGHERKWNEIKKEIASVAGKVYELRNSEKYISNDDFYYDCSHYNAKLGEILKAQILADM